MKTPEEFLKSNGFVTAAEIDRQALISTFLSEMEKGLRGEPSSLLMIPTYVGVDGKIPEGAKAAVLDAGGTNFRGGIVTIPPAISDKQNQPMPGTKGLVDKDTFYRAFADEIRRARRRRRSAGASPIRPRRRPSSTRSSCTGRRTSRRPRSSATRSARSSRST